MRIFNDNKKKERDNFCFANVHFKCGIETPLSLTNFALDGEDSFSFYLQILKIQMKLFFDLL